MPKPTTIGSQIKIACHCQSVFTCHRTPALTCWVAAAVARKAGLGFASVDSGELLFDSGVMILKRNPEYINNNNSQTAGKTKMSGTAVFDRYVDHFGEETASGL